MAFEKVGVRASIEGMRAFERNAERFNRRIAGMGRATKGLGGPLGVIRNSLGRMGGALSNVAQIAGGIIVANVFGKIANAISGAARAVVGFTKDSIFLSARVEELDVIVKLLGKRAGLTEGEIDGIVQSIKDLGITTDVAQGLVIQFSRWQLNLADATKLARLAQDAAVISMQDSSEALAGLMHGITTLNTRVLRTYGITLASTVDAQDEYAASVGKTRDELSGAEKIQAVLNAVLAQGESIAGAYEAAMGTAGKQMRSMRRHVKELMILIGTPFLKAFGGVIKNVTGFWKTMRKAAEEGGPLNRIVTKIADVFSEKFVGALDVAGNVLENVIKLVDQWFKLTDAGLGTFEALAVAIKRMVPKDAARSVDKFIDFFRKMIDMGPIAKRILLGPFAAFLGIIRLIGKAVKGLVLGEFKLEDILPPFVIKAWEDFLGVVDRFRAWWDKNGPKIQAQAERIFGTIAGTIGGLAERIIPFVVEQLEKFSGWFDMHEDVITGAIKNIADFFEFTLGPAVTKLWNNVMGPFFSDVIDSALEALGALADFLGGRDEFADIDGGVMSLQMDFKRQQREAKGFFEFIEEIDRISREFLEDKFPEIFRSFREFVLNFFGLPNWEVVAESWRGIWDNLTLIFDTWIANIKGKLKLKNLLENFLFTPRGVWAPIPIPESFRPQASPAGPGNLGGPYSRDLALPPITIPAQIPQGNNYNLTVHTSAPSEPIIADFKMLAALGGRP